MSFAPLSTLDEEDDPPEQAANKKQNATEKNVGLRTQDIDASNQDLSETLYYARSSPPINQQSRK